MKDNYLSNEFIKIPLEDKNLYDNDFNNVIKELTKMLKDEYQATIEIKKRVGMSGNEFNTYYLVLKRKD